MSKKQSLDKLINFIEDVSTKDTHMFFRNSFALCCYLMKCGERKAAKKQLSYLFEFLGKDRRKTYFLEIMNSLDEYAEEYAREVSANQEINELFSTPEYKM